MVAQRNESPYTTSRLRETYDQPKNFRYRQWRSSPSFRFGVYLMKCSLLNLRTIPVVLLLDFTAVLGFRSHFLWPLSGISSSITDDYRSTLGQRDLVRQVLEALTFIPFFYVSCAYLLQSFHVNGRNWFRLYYAFVPLRHVRPLASFILGSLGQDELWLRWTCKRRECCVFDFKFFFCFFCIQSHRNCKSMCMSL